MDQDEKKYIKSNCVELHKLINSTPELILRLMQDDVFTYEEEEVINSRPTKIERTRELITILETRTGAFQKLISALQHCKQTGAVNILKHYQSSKLAESTIFRSTVGNSWFYCGKGHPINLVLISKDLWLTRKRLLDNIPGLDITETQISKAVPFLKCTVLSGLHGSFEQYDFVICDWDTVCKIKLPHKNCKIVEDKFTWFDLTEKTQQMLLCSTKLVFQRHTLCLEDVCRIITATATESSNSKILQDLPTEFLIKLLNEEIITIETCRSLLPKPQPYINRSLASRSRISRKVLQLTMNIPTTDVFVIQCDGLCFFQFASFVAKYGNKKCNLSDNFSASSYSDQTKSFLLTNPDHFDLICETIKTANEKANQNAKKNTNINESGTAIEKVSVHLLVGKAEKGEIKTLEWMRTSGSIQSLQKYVHYIQEEIERDDFFDKVSHQADSCNTMPVCISGTFGMGRSSLLSCLARYLQTQHSKSKPAQAIIFVHRFIVIDFLNLVTNEVECSENAIFSGEEEIEVLVSALCECCFTTCELLNKLVRAIFSYGNPPDPNVLVKTFKLELMFDGIEELDSNRIDIALKIIDKIQNFIPFNFPVRIWVTTSLNMVLETEKRLGVFAYIMQPLKIKDQVKLLTNIWAPESQSTQIKMEKLAQSCIQSLCGNFQASPLNGNAEDATEIPLLCTLLAECSKQVAGRLHRNSVVEFPSHVGNFTVYAMYNQFVISKISKSSEDATMETWLRYLQAALDILFPDEFENLLTHSYKYSELLKDGILEERCVFAQGCIHNNDTREVRFIHGSFGWYFAAEGLLFILGMLQQGQLYFVTETKYLLITRLLGVDNIRIILSTLPNSQCTISTFTFSYPTLCYFVNILLQKTLNVQRLVEFWLENFPTDQNQLVVVLTDILMAAIVSNYLFIADHIMRALDVIFSKNENFTLGFELCLNLELLAAKYSSITLFHRLETFIKKFGNTEMIPRNSCKSKDYDSTDDSIEEEVFAEFKIMTELDLDFKDASFSKCNRPNLLIFANQNEISVLYPNQVIFRATLTPLHIAIEAGNIDVAIHLLGENGMKSALRKYPTKYRCLFNACVVSSIVEDGSVIIRKKKIMNLLAGMCPNIFTRNIVTENLELEEMHIELLLEYLKIRENLESTVAAKSRKIAVNKYGENFMHLLARGHYHLDITPAQYHAAVEQIMSIPEFTSSRVLKHLLARNAFDWRAIDVAASRIDLLEETLNLYEELRRNSVAEIKSSEQHLRLLFNKSRALIKPEMKLYEKLFSMDLENQNDAADQLETLMASLKSEKLVSFTLWDTQRRAHQINWDMQKDFRGSNILYKAIAGQQKTSFLEKLLNAYPNLLGNKQKLKYLDATMLHVATGYLNLDAVKFIIDRKLADVNAQDINGNTPLHVCFRLEQMQLANQDQCNDEVCNKTVPDPIPTSLSRVKTCGEKSQKKKSGLPKLDTQQTQRSGTHGVDDSPAPCHPSTPVSQRYSGNVFELFNSGVANFQTTLRFYPRSSDIDPNNQQKIISLLIENGANIDIKNEYNTTPLHLALTNLCVSGLEAYDRDKLNAAGDDLFTPKYLTLALKGLLLNKNLGERLHPSLIASFAKAIKKCGGDINYTENHDGASFLHLAARKHSFYAVKHLIEVEGFHPKMPDMFEKSPLEYMTCKEACDVNNCLELRQYLRD